MTQFLSKMDRFVGRAGEVNVWLLNQNRSEDQSTQPDTGEEPVVGMLYIVLDLGNRTKRSDAAMDHPPGSPALIRGAIHGLRLA
jgi:hypothetical protein